MKNARAIRIVLPRRLLNEDPFRSPSSTIKDPVNKKECAVLTEMVVWIHGGKYMDNRLRK